ncbi:MAG: Vacuolar H+transporting two-sector ATPase F subunit [Anaerolineae bacterium]|nr:Vacuolar H+transporting two-sector ATPase F subunit [Anaerolineae bacterium]
MKLLVIGNPDAVWGFALTGVGGRIATTGAALEAALDDALADENVGIILITEDVADLARRRVDQLMARSAVPLVVEIPGPGGPSLDRPPLREVLRQTLGLKI